jgi:hypothetical protein
VAALLLAGALGLPAPAFADTGGSDSLLNSGAIAGGLFTADPLAPAKPPTALSPVIGPVQTAMPEPLPANPGPDLCGPAVARASASHNLPPGLLNAIAMVESGRLNPRTGNIKPWPWTIDANGTGYMYATEQAAEQAAASFEASGITSLDIGCLQVNLAQHPDAFQNLAQAFDPASNANYAASFLTSLQQKFADWPQAIAAYHSQTPALGGPYEARVYAQWQNAGAAPMALAAAGTAANGQTVTPWPVAPLPQTAFDLSTLAPPRGMTLPGNRMTGRTLASYRAAPVAIAASQPPQG